MGSDSVTYHLVQVQGAVMYTHCYCCKAYFNTTYKHLQSIQMIKKVRKMREAKLAENRTDLMKYIYA